MREMQKILKRGTYKFENRDCMEGMKEYPDKYFDLAIVDPPYGGGQAQELVDDLKNTKLSGGGANWQEKERSRFGGIFNKYKIKVTRTGETWAEKYETKVRHWDIAPDETYFNELARISKNQIIWGGNYFHLPPTRCFLVWRKLTISENFTMAMCEYAWTSFNQNSKWIEIAPQDSKRFHPTQKPIKLFRWILEHYAKEGDKILDTHVGSASSIIACIDMGFDVVGYELDKDYFDMANKRISDYLKQLVMGL